MHRCTEHSERQFKLLHCCNNSLKRHRRLYHLRTLKTDFISSQSRCVCHYMVHYQHVCNPTTSPFDHRAGTHTELSGELYSVVGNFTNRAGMVNQTKRKVADGLSVDFSCRFRLQTSFFHTPQPQRTSSGPCSTLPRALTRQYLLIRQSHQHEAKLADALYVSQVCAHSARTR